jgi:Ca-activated chloride channel family protein
VPLPRSSGGDAAVRAAALRQAIERGDHSPQTLYNYGTALLAADSAEAAIAALTRVVDARDPDVRYRAWFNLGLAHLKRGLAAGTGESATSELDAAIDAYKRVLLTRPTDQDARWNYELALRQRQGGGRGGSSGAGQGGGAGGGGGAGQPPSPPAARSPATMPSALGHRQAEELLNSAAREERDVQGRVQRQNPADVPPGGKDW